MNDVSKWDVKGIADSAGTSFSLLGAITQNIIKDLKHNDGKVSVHTRTELGNAVAHIMSFIKPQ